MVWPIYNHHWLPHGEHNCKEVGLCQILVISCQFVQITMLLWCVYHQGDKVKPASHPQGLDGELQTFHHFLQTSMSSRLATPINHLLPWLEWSWLLTASLTVIRLKNTNILPLYLCNSSGSFSFSSLEKCWSWFCCTSQCCSNLTLTNISSVPGCMENEVRERMKGKPSQPSLISFLFWKRTFVELPGAAPVSPTAARTLFTRKGLKSN